MKRYILIAALLLLPISVFAITKTGAGVFVSASSQYGKKSSPTGFPTGHVARTIALWVKTSSTSAQCGFEGGDASGSTVEQFSFCINTGGTHDIGISGDGGNVFYNASTVDDGSWHLISYTYDGSGSGLGTGGKGYMDGVALTQASSNDQEPATIAACAMIGANNGGSCVGSNFLNGKETDVRLWTRALSSTEEANLYSNPCTFANGTNLVGWWKMDTDFTDTQTTNNLTNTNTVTFSGADLPYSTCTATTPSFAPWQFAHPY